MFLSGIIQSVGTFKWPATICKRCRAVWVARIWQILNLAPASAPRLALHPTQGEGTLAGNSLMCVLICLHICQCTFTLAVLILLFRFNATTALTRYALDQIKKLWRDFPAEQLSWKSVPMEDEWFDEGRPHRSRACLLRGARYTAPVSMHH